MRRWLLFIIIGLLALPGALQAQDTPWSAWLYNPAGFMTSVSSNGSVRDIALPTVSGQSYPQQVAVSRAGDAVAYMTSNPQLNAHRLVIYNLTTEAVSGDFVVTDLFANSLAFNAAPEIFSENGTELALGLAPMDGNWRLLILNTRNSATMAELTPSAPAATDASLPSGVGIVPVVRHLQAGIVAFDLQASAEAEETLGSYFWNPIANTVTSNDLYPGDSVALFGPTGDVVVTGYDGGLPALAPSVANTAYATSPTLSRRAPFYTDAAHALARPTFVQNGERVMLNTLAGDGSSAWQVVERSGETVGAVAFSAIDLFGLHDGFLYLTPDDAHMLMLASTRDDSIDAGQAVGMAPPGVEMQLAWAGDSVAQPASAYAPWFDLTDPVSITQATQSALGVTAPPTEVVDAGPTPEPTSEFFVAPPPVFLPTPSAFTTQLQVGDRAVVTRAGHAAGLRTAPDDSAPAIILLYTDMFADILEGPEITDGYIWWRITTVGANPTTGWAVEGAQGQAWLVPVGR
jgi:hypothetical protein